MGTRAIGIGGTVGTAIASSGVIISTGINGVTVTIRFVELARFRAPQLATGKPQSFASPAGQIVPIAAFITIDNAISAGFLRARCRVDRAVVVTRKRAGPACAFLCRASLGAGNRLIAWLDSLNDSVAAQRALRRVDRTVVVTRKRAGPACAFLCRASHRTRNRPIACFGTIDHGIPAAHTLRCVERTIVIARKRA